MKKLLLLFLAMGVFLMVGCTKEYLAHDTLYKNWGHVKFSWWEYKSPTAENAKMSNAQGWWGKEIPYIPAQ